MRLVTRLELTQSRGQLSSMTFRRTNCRRMFLSSLRVRDPTRMPDCNARLIFVRNQIRTPRRKIPQSKCIRLYLQQVNNTWTKLGSPKSDLGNNLMWENLKIIYCINCLAVNDINCLNSRITAKVVGGQSVPTQKCFACGHMEKLGVRWRSGGLKPLSTPSNLSTDGISGILL